MLAFVYTIDMPILTGKGFLDVIIEKSRNYRGVFPSVSIVRVGECHRPCYKGLVAFFIRERMNREVGETARNEKSAIIIKQMSIRRWDRISCPFCPHKSLLLNFTKAQNAKVVLSHLLNPQGYPISLSPTQLLENDQ